MGQAEGGGGGWAGSQSGDRRTSQDCIRRNPPYQAYFLGSFFGSGSFPFGVVLPFLSFDVVCFVDISIKKKRKKTCLD